MSRGSWTAILDDREHFARIVRNWCSRCWNGVHDHVEYALMRQMAHYNKTDDTSEGRTWQQYWKRWAACAQ